ncbi:MAG: DNA polymerase III subunit gamma/tau [Thermodesulfovibrio sp.]|nr:DNA polymerase III subunit gamma/tau [Thermodesulfovibrio sp.]
MSYLVLARKWRPKGFEDLVGQGPIMRILSNALTQGKIAHAYIFSGPRGVGKTSSARILAKALNCIEGPTPTPCGICNSCVSIADGSSVDVIEIDGASNNSVDDIRDLRERVKYAPSSGKYKVYIIDEVHMLSGSAFNALLKTLEEPPPHVIFVLATTEMKKIPATVLSRCQHMPFRRISTGEIRARLQHISEAEGINIAPAALGLVARAADGSMRDSLTILDQISSFTSEITEEDVKNLLGITDFGLLAATSKALLAGDRVAILDTINNLTEQGADIRTFTKELVQFFRDLLVASVVKKPEDVLDLSEDEMVTVREITATAGEDQMTLMLSEIMKADADVRYASSPRLALEMALIKASFLSSMKPLKEVIERLGRLNIPERELLPPATESGRDKPAPVARPLPQKAVTQPAQKQPSPVIDDRQGEEKPVEVIQNQQAPALPPSAPAADEQDERAADSAPAPDAVHHSGESTGDIARAWEQLLTHLDPPLASKLSQIHYELKDHDLLLTLNGGQAVFEDSIKESSKEIEKILSELYGTRLKVRLGTAPKKAAKKKSDLKEKVMGEPLIMEALELFDGRIVDVTPIDTANK